MTEIDRRDDWTETGDAEETWIAEQTRLLDAEEGLGTAA
jgi:hypothetical protein